MMTSDQSEIIGFLADPSTHGGTPVERIDTHASVVFLAGTRAFKLKRAVRYDYLDFSTVERRRLMCEAELAINRRLAPALYRRVLPVTRSPDGRLALDGTGPPADWLIEMVRFDQACLFDRLAARGALDLGAMPALAAAIARFHAAAPRRRDHGGRAGMAWVIDGNETGFAEQGAGILDPAPCADVTRRSRAALDRQAALLDRRRAEGRVRQCHGDLHLRNIVLLAGQPTLFDAVEFNDEIACIDVGYDLAFLLMDLDHRGLGRHAHAVFNAYLAETGDVASLALLPLFLSCRAAVRAKTSASAARVQSEADRRVELEALARRYLDLAGERLTPPPARLVAVGGFSGSGKSTLAVGLAPALGPRPGALVVRSDEVRKRLLGVDPLTPLGADGYAADISRRVYQRVCEQAAAVLRHGHAALVDAVFARPEDRAAIESIAAGAGVPFAGLWLDAPELTLAARADARRHDPSDADADVVQAQIARGAGDVRWHRLDASGDADAVLAHAVAMLGAAR